MVKSAFVLALVFYNTCINREPVVQHQDVMYRLPLSSTGRKSCLGKIAAGVVAEV